MQPDPGTPQNVLLLALSASTIASTRALRASTIAPPRALRASTIAPPAAENAMLTSIKCRTLCNQDRVASEIAL